MQFLGGIWPNNRVAPPVWEILDPPLLWVQFPLEATLFFAETFLTPPFQVCTNGRNGRFVLFAKTSIGHLNSNQNKTRNSASLKCPFLCLQTP